MSKMITSSDEQTEDTKLDITLRPQSFSEYVGQNKVKKNLNILIKAAQKRGEPIEHVLLYGPAGLGKTTLAHIIAREMGANIRATSGPAIEKVGDLGSILTNLNDGDILFIDEIHRLNKLIEEVLYPAMEEFKLDIIIGKGPSAKTLELDLPRFTLIGATTRLGAISSPLRNRFGVIHRLDFYENEDIEKILHRSSKILSIPIESAGAKTISRSSRRTPRVANRLLKRARDFTQVENCDTITEELSRQTLANLEIDELGLEPTDRFILKTIIEKFSGGPVGIQTIATATMEEIETIEGVYEPYLIQIGFLARTPRGRVATESAYKHLGIEYNKENQDKLF
ncbi:MAG: Holliday junction branch migration DNA helicase RuvB [Candidatus Moranbacteria bacterium CG_4_10_14_3_um_filter_44_15]|nr:MAG: Holliday junction branch migration DNA helicase RuvB [Candidatus Moranbacteria bacterium CG06_land_8_20_14_3_00_43_56]PIV84106.1 MAG: Holliday junction branch migration DNA helicase RuvB [Candidatus Moranbacteria bacterium CG17_big_fil_post_rev_8_21_14_2_50_44_12]PIW93599.1 MAG: Holliday junction branch migration DNA helicase RuvB [Candidatus Moranbacteria bacterium CG_4_8_14_3_um_filter_43_15]PIX91030.1 MAG: Holliday junction branch migration DNA helicase RuvB [Candidatus Moranbacteria 